MHWVPGAAQLLAEGPAPRPSDPVHARQGARLAAKHLHDALFPADEVDPDDA